MTIFSHLFWPMADVDTDISGYFFQLIAENIIIVPTLIVMAPDLLWVYVVKASSYQPSVVVAGMLISVFMLR